MAQPFGDYLVVSDILLPYHSGIELFGIYPRELKTYVHTMDIYSSFVHNCQNVEATKMPFSR